MEELKALLENYFISKGKNREVYFAIKDNYKKFKPLIVDKLGYELLIRGDFIKLEKLPGRAEAWMGIENFDDTKEYVFFMILLIFLEDKNKEEQFLLSHVTDFISSNAMEDKVDWTDYSTRRSLIKVMKVAIKQNIILVTDGQEDDFVHDNTKEVLYESTGFSKYMVRNFPKDIMNCSSYKELEEEEFLDKDRGRVRRNRVYRRLLLSPIVYNEGVEDEDYIYLKTYRNVIENDFRIYLNWPLHVHRNGAMVILNEKDRFKNSFPSQLGICDVVLHFNFKILDMIKAGNINRDVGDIIHLRYEEFKSIIEDLKNDMGHGWSKEYRECSIEKLNNEVLSFMESFSMIKQGEDISIYPLVAKITGAYPLDYKGGVKDGE